MSGPSHTVIVCLGQFTHFHFLLLLDDFVCGGETDKIDTKWEGSYRGRGAKSETCSRARFVGQRCSTNQKQNEGTTYLRVADCIQRAIR
jgi:hypothetical protein